VIESIDKKESSSKKQRKDLVKWMERLTLHPQSKVSNKREKVTENSGMKHW
jgi:hypothetical protein